MFPVLPQKWLRASLLVVFLFFSFDSSADLSLQASHATTAASGDHILVGAGDIGACNTRGAKQTGALLDHIPGTVFTAGDNAYPDGTLKNFADCYHPFWGRHRSRTRPAPGNHDYHVASAPGYFAYFGPSAGDPAQGYYSYQLGSWRIFVLNSNCDQVGGCQPGSPQEQWLRAELARHSAPCTLAIWHHPRFSSGHHGNFEPVQPFWQALWEAGADVVLTGHDHDYERLAPMDATGRRDPASGLRQFVVGTGGARLRSFRPFVLESSEARNSKAWGVLKLTLGERSYDWEFIPVPGQTFRDSGSSPCH